MGKWETDALGCWAGLAALVMVEEGLAVAVASTWLEGAHAMLVRALTATVAVRKARMVGSVASMA